jgi:MtN3 and saliva related transmembrane protein
MEWTTIIGYVAGICTTAAVVPQLVKSWRTKKVRDVSPFMFGTLITGVGLWTVYGIMKNDVPIIATNGLSLALNMLMVYFMVRFGKRNDD